MTTQKTLAGMRVLDLSWFGAGPVSTRWLAAAGAQVIRVETQQRLDGIRPQEPKVGDPTSPNSSLFFNNLNTDKLGLLLDLNNSKGLEIARRLVRISDIVITNFSPRNLDKWGLDYESLRALREDVIVIHIPAMGLSGPKVNYVGFGAGFKALGGLNMLNGFEGTPPVGPQGTFTDWCLVPSHCVTALLSALHYRQRTGQGQLIEVSQYECIINGTGISTLEYTANGRLLPRTGNRHPRMAPHGHYPCQGEERWIAIAVEGEEQWRALCGVAGAAWGDEPRFATPAARLANQDALDVLVGGWTGDQEAYDLMHRLQRARVPAGVIENVQDIFENDDQLKGREHYVWVDQTEVGRWPVDRPGFRLSKTHSTPERGSPCMGEHNDYVLRDLLGLTLEEVNELILERVLY